MFKVKLSQLQELADSYSYSDDGYEVKITEENGEKYIAVNTKQELFKDRIKELKQLIKSDKEEFQNSVNKYMVTSEDMDGIIVDSCLKKLRYHNSELSIILKRR